MLVTNNYQIINNHLIMELSSLYVSIIHGYSAYHNFHTIANEIYIIYRRSQKKEFYLWACKKTSL